MSAVSRRLKPWILRTWLLAATLLLSHCVPMASSNSRMIVSVRDQQLLLTQNGVPVKTYKISTSKFGLGSRSGSNCTPIGRLGVAKKIGGFAPKGMVFKSRRPTGEILKPNAPGRDPIVSRIIWLHGKESHNRNTFRRCIYIHGTPEEWRLGSPASYGCIRMGSADVIDLYKRIHVGAEVQVIRGPLISTPEGQQYARLHPRAIAQNR